jgi:hypothetical protein
MRISCDIPSTCEHLPPIRSLTPSYCTAFASAPHLVRPLEEKKKLSPLRPPSRSDELPPLSPTASPASPLRSGELPPPSLLLFPAYDVELRQRHNTGWGWAEPNRAAPRSSFRPTEESSAAAQFPPPRSRSPLRRSLPPSTHVEPCRLRSPTPLLTSHTTTLRRQALRPSAEVMKS